MTTPSVLFVCRGNYCRSPMAEGAFRLALRRAGVAADCDSAGIAPEREGEAPDWRARMIAGRHGANISGQRSRLVRPDDFTRHTLILAMDAHNLSALQRMAPVRSMARIALLFDMVRGRQGKSLRDPFSGNVADFHDCWRQLVRATRELAERLADGYRS